MGGLKVGAIQDKMRRSDRQIDDPREIAAILTRGRVGHLAVALDNQPYVVPMLYICRNDKIILHGAREGLMRRVVAENPNVCFEVSESKGWVPADKAAYQGLVYRSVVAFGRVRLIDEPSPKIRVMKEFLAKYARPIRNWEILPEDVANIIVLEIDIERLTGKRRLPFPLGQAVRLLAPGEMPPDQSVGEAGLTLNNLYTVEEVDQDDRIRLHEADGWFPWQWFERIIDA